jgi:TonB-dependent receptor
MHYLNTNKTLIALAVAGACTAFNPAWAQDRDPASNPVNATGAGTGTTTSADGGVQQVVVSGIRQSMASSLNLKRNSDGIVDGIVAEDIGKFPDTNLAESLQRISGVSIDRTNGEGQRVTVRGIGPDYNMVLLNGRQMPTSNLGDLNGRAFDFSNLASEAISQLQVYKTSRAETPTGGIGATINVMTARPFDHMGTWSSIGIKGDYDSSHNNLPQDDKAGSAWAPEFSGIFSTTSKDGMWGLGGSFSYQKRNSGYAQASVGNGWKGPFTATDTGYGSIPATGAINRPSGSTIYEVPQNLNYGFTGVERKRTNGQLVLQFAPTKDITTTLDYTYAENKLHTLHNDVSAWFNFGPSTSTWTNGPVAAPLIYTEQIPAGNSDVAMGAADYATKTQNKSVGFNAQWRATGDLKFEFDAHHSTAESMADSPFGSSNDIGTASFSRGNTTADFSQDFPVLSIQGANFAAAPQQVTGSTFQEGYMRGQVDQGQFKGRLRMLDSSSLNFGLGVINVKNRSAFSNNQRDSWGGASKPSDYPSSLWHPATVRGYFDEIAGSNNPNLFNNFNTFNFQQVRDVVAQATGLPALYMPKAAGVWDTDQRTTEKTKNLYLQFNTDWDTRFPMHTAVGVRYEKTDVTSSAQVASATGITMVSANEFSVTQGSPTFTTLTGEYHNLLPSIDWDMDLRSDMKVRASYGETIGRPRYDQIAGGQILNTLYRVDGGTGSQGNPALKPVKSNNFDLSWEWYYAKQSFFSVNAFYKDIDNFAGQSQFDATPFDLHTPVGGALWNEAMASGCGSDTACIRQYIFTKHPTAPGVTVTGVANGAIQGNIVGQPGDPIAHFRIASYANQKKASLNGLELNLQHMFANSGFGIAANYTYVHSDLRYNNASPIDQFALPGLSNSYNVVGIYENDKVNARLAYNWRGEFLASTQDGSGFNPQYVQAYGQFDVSIGYNLTPKLTLQLEGINLTNETARVHGRNSAQALYVTQTGPRYMIGARYKF